MPSTRRQHSAYAAHALLLLALSTTTMAALNQMTYKGCYSSSTPLKNQGSYTYQTSGYCQPICVKANQAVLATSQGSQCWCGDELPAASSKVSDDKCSTPCNGYDTEDCGGNGYWSVYLSGTEANVASYGGSGSSGSSQQSSSPSSTTAAPSVVTSVSPGKTVIVTRPASQPSSSSSSSSDTAAKESSSGGGLNVTAVAAGVVVAVVVVSGALAALFFWMRHRKRVASEEEYKRTQVADFMKGGDQNPPPTGYSTTSDSRLEPAFGGRRDSSGSIADNQDYSRKILRVANPDRS